MDKITPSEKRQQSTPAIIKASTGDRVVFFFTCLRCGYKWQGKKIPKTCANKTCNSPYWNRKKVKNSGPRKHENQT